jgi:O-acetylserine/cysteine efflux transporter
VSARESEAAAVKSSSLSLRDALLALAIMIVWGTNFVIVRVALDVMPPLLFAALRFTFVFAPLALVLPRPKIRWANLAAYGVFIGLGQFGLLFIAMNGMISPGLASLVIQMQVFFTIGLAMLRDGERLRSHQILAFVLAIIGMGVIVAHNGHGATLPGLALTLAAAASWALGNETSKEAGAVDMLAYVVWASLFSLLPLWGLSLLLEGPKAIVAGLTHATLATWAAVLWQSIGNTMFGYGCWAWLLSRYPAATVAPMSLLVPLFGFAAAAVVLAEPLQDWKIAAAALVMMGLAINTFWKKEPKVSSFP